MTREKNRRFKFYKSCQLFICADNQTLSVAAMRVSNEDRSPRRIDRCNTAPTPTGFAQIIRDDLPVIHTARFCLFRSTHGNDKNDIRGAMARATKYGSRSTAATGCYFRVWPGTSAFSPLTVKSQVTG